MSSLEIKSLSYRGLGPFSLSLSSQQCIGVIGESGVGKTLFLRAIADLDPHEGEVFLDAVEMNEFPPAIWRKQVGLLLSESFWWYDTVAEHLEDKREDLLESLHLSPHLLDEPLQRLSSGERQRFAQALPKRRYQNHQGPGRPGRLSPVQRAGF